MKQILVHALILVLVGVAAGMGASSAATSAPVLRPCCAKLVPKLCPPTAQCPFADERCEIEATPGTAAEPSAPACEPKDCCDDHPERDCCRKKAGRCPRCEDAMKSPKNEDRKPD